MRFDRTTSLDQRQSAALALTVISSLSVGISDEVGRDSADRHLK
jgi:hypothetical protein